jgi:MYXO-CTERM domain-containing protein
MAPNRLLLVASIVALAGTLPSVAAAAGEPPTPKFGPSIEGFAAYDPQDTCDPTAKPGAVSFRDFILGTYSSTGDYGITRACSTGGTSEHKEGRAWDWKVNYFDAGQRDVAKTVIDWLLKTDEHGNACALARRTGMMYFIWNKAIWGSYRSPNSSCASAGWKAYTGTNPHTDHVHISWAWPGAKKQTSWWSSPLPANAKPKGHLDGADCDRVWGWSQDPDVSSKSIDVHLYFGDAAGDPGAEGVPVAANLSRDDLCAPLGSCAHGFEVASPLSLHDGQPHPVHAYGIDSAGGANAELTESPGALVCKPVIPQGVRRHVIDGQSFSDWDFSYFWDVMPVADAALHAIPAGPNLPSDPVLVRADDGSAEVWLIDGAVRRHVPSPAVMEAWGFDSSAISSWPANEVYALPQGPDVRARPVLVKGSDAAVYLMDDLPPDPLTDPPLGSGGESSSGTGGNGGGWAGNAGGGDPKNGSSQKTQLIGEEESGCACRSSGSQRSPSGIWLAGLLSLVALGRRRPRRA